MPGKIYLLPTLNFFSRLHSSNLTLKIRKASFINLSQNEICMEPSFPGALLIVLKHVASPASINTFIQSINLAPTLRCCGDARTAVEFFISSPVHPWIYSLLLYRLGASMRYI